MNRLMCTQRVPLVVLLVLAIGLATAGDVRAVNQTTSMSSEQIRDAASRVMQQQDYRSVRRRVLENLPETESVTDTGFLQRTLGAMGDPIGDFLEWIFSGLFSTGPRPRGGTTTPAAAPPASSGGVDFSMGKLLLLIGLAVLVVVVIWILGMVLKASDGRRRINHRELFGEEEDLSELTIPPGELAASTYESRAIRLASEGNFRAAIRELLLGGMSWIERAGRIRFRKGLTNRDYIRAVWHEEERRFAFGKTALQFERIYFGRREATHEMFEICLQSFQGAFREEATTTTV